MTLLFLQLLLAYVVIAFLVQPERWTRERGVWIGWPLSSSLHVLAAACAVNIGINAGSSPEV